MAVRLIEVPEPVARNAALALERRGERGGGTRAAVMLATALTTGFVKPAELGELRGWHHANPDEVIGAQCTTLAGLHGGAPAREWLADLTVRTAAALNPAGTGAMIALPVPPEITSRIARPDGEPAAEMHVTLFHFGGDAADLDPALRDTLVTILEEFTPAQPAPTVDLSHVERFVAGDEGLEPVVLVDDGPSVYALRDRLEEELAAFGVPYSNDHAFRVHTTIGYYAAGDGPESGPLPMTEGNDGQYRWTPDGIRLHWGDEVTSYPFADPDGADPMTAAVGNPLRAKLAKVSAMINRADRTTMVRLHAAATVALNEALRQASNKITGKANDRRKSAAARAAVQAANGVYPPAVLAAVGVTEQELLDRRFDTFEAMAIAMIAAAERKKLAAAARALGLAPDEVEHEYAEQIDTRAAAAGAMMVTALGLLARSALSGHAVTPESVKGEFSGPVPFGIIRDAVTVASRGGSVPVVDETGPGPSAIDALAGKLSDVGESLVEDLLATMDVRVQVRSTWSHGDPDRPFEPHLTLDGVSWVDTQPEELTWDAGEFPYVDVLQPGDHEGCTCLIETEYEPYDGDGGAPVGDGADAGASGDSEGVLAAV